MNQRELIRDLLTRPAISSAISFIVTVVTAPGVIRIAPLLRLGYFAHLWWCCLGLRHGLRRWRRAHYLYGRWWWRGRLDWRGAHYRRRGGCCLRDGGRFALAEGWGLRLARHAAVDAWIVAKIAALLHFLARHGWCRPPLFPYRWRCAWCRRGHYRWAGHWCCCGHLAPLYQGWINLSWCGSLKPLIFAGV